VTPVTGTTAPAPTASTTEDTAAPTPLRDAYHTAPLDTVDTKTYQGWKYFNLNCARCHGEDALGTMLAPHLIVSLKPDGTIPNEGIFLQVVCGGRPEKGMPAWCTLGLSTAQIDTIYAYVKGRSDAKIHPGRPARR
jgi:mono/diheme cytochrome c family protein